MFTITGTTTTERGVTIKYGEDDVMDALGFIPHWPLKVLGEWYDLYPDGNYYAIYYDELVVMSDKEYKRVKHQERKFGSYNLRPLSRDQFQHIYGVVVQLILDDY